MKISLRSRVREFDEILTDLIDARVMVIDKKKLPEKTTLIQLKTKKRLGDLNLEFLFAYRIFPSSILISQTEWASKNRKMRIGDTILQQVFIPPFKSLSLKMIFGVRINSIIDEPSRKGFSYQTLSGHVERGESVFVVEENDAGLVFKIQSFSEPANFFTKLGGPIFSVPYQAHCTAKALENVKRQIERI